MIRFSLVTSLALLVHVGAIEPFTLQMKVGGEYAIRCVIEPAVTQIGEDGEWYSKASVKFPQTALTSMYISFLNWGESMHGMNVRVAEVGMWNIDLAAGAYTADVAALERGFSPARIRPQNLIAYWPLVRGLQDVRGGHTLTATNSPVVVEHPRVIA